jgi:hypothetical protein
MFVLSQKVIGVFKLPHQARAVRSRTLEGRRERRERTSDKGLRPQYGENVTNVTGIGSHIMEKFVS